MYELGETGMIYYRYLTKKEEQAYQEAYSKAKAIVGQIAAKCQLDPTAESIINTFPEIPGLNIDWNSILEPPTVGEATATSTVLVIAILAILLLA